MTCATGISADGLTVVSAGVNPDGCAEPLFIQALEGHRLKLGDEHPDTQESQRNLIELYKAWGKPEKAEEWRAKLPETEAVEQ